MKKLIVVIAWLFLIPMLALAQNADHPPRWQGYGFVGAGTHEMSPTAGFGGEVYVFKGLGIGAEVGVGGLDIHGDQNMMIGVGSADLSYHFFPKKIRGNAAPFVAGGYTLFFGHNAADGEKDVTPDGFNIGGGVDVFATKHVGVRFDVRYHGHGGRILKYTFPDVAQFSFVAFRIGVTFR